MDEIRLCGPLHAHSGYSKFTRAVLRTALLAGYKVQAVESNYRVLSTHFRHGEIKERRRHETFKAKYPVPIVQRLEVEKALKTRVSPQAPTLLIQFPEQCGGWHEFSQGPRIGWTMIESDRLTNEKWIKGLYGVDMLIAPSRYVWGTFKRDVPEIPLELLYLPVDDRIYNTEPGDVEIAGRYPDFLFMSVFNNRERKQWRIMMQAFFEEFGEDESVGFLIRPGRLGEVQELADWCRPVGRDAKRHMYVMNKWLSEGALAAYYRRADCFILPSCEGFGLPFVEAALCGTPSIALDAGGAWDVVDNSTGWRIPHRMDQVLGNLPHVYDSSHLFAVPQDIYAVRHAMRRAFQSKEDKGRAARHRAETQFTPQALAEPLRKAIEKASEPFRLRTKMTRSWDCGDHFEKVQYPHWGLLVGDGYGDAIGVLGNCQHVLENSGKQMSVLHYGFNKGLKEFLELQPAIAEVRQIVPPDKETAMETGNEVGGYYAYPASKWLPSLLKGTGIDPSDVALTQIHWPWGTWPVYRPTDLRLSEAAEKWADEKKAELGEFVMVQPYSTSSVDLNSHWPFWTPFLRWLIASTEGTHRLVFCGLNPIPGLGGPNVVDLIGQSPSMMHVFALADRAKAVITTCNALAHWTACRGIKGFVMANQAIPRKDNYWYRFLATKNNTAMPLETSLPNAIKAAEKWMGGLSK